MYSAPVGACDSGLSAINDQPTRSPCVRVRSHLRSTLVIFLAVPMSQALTLVAKRSELSDSGRSFSDGDTFTNISVLLHAALATNA